MYLTVVYLCRKKVVLCRYPTSSGDIDSVPRLTLLDMYTDSMH